MTGKRIRHNWDLVKGARYDVIPRGPAPGIMHRTTAIAVRSIAPVDNDTILFTLRLKFAGDDLHYDVDDFAAVFEV